jgi:Fe-S-cluster containining protein
MSATATSIDPRVPGRRCGTCTLCCKVLRVIDIDKPRGQWCVHCDVGHGCRIYETRPEGCRQFFCGFLVDERLPETWRPAESKIVLLVEGDGKRIIAHVDPDRPTAWRREPFYSTLKRWSAAMLHLGGNVAVSIGQRCIVVLPDRDVDLGKLEDDEAIATQQRSTATGVIYDVVKVKRGGPRLTDPPRA